MRKEIAPRIVIDDQVCGGRPVIAGTRTAVEFVIGHLAAGMTQEAVAEEYDLQLEDIRAALAYAADIITNDLPRSVP